jgi:AcrR family transcriptional regulator
MGSASKGHEDRPRLPEKNSAPGDVRPRQPPLRKLKPGPGLSPHAVFTDQRRRLLTATVDLVAELGYERITVRALSQRAGVSTRTFYRHFDNVDDCLGFVSESTMDGVLRRMKEASSAAQGREEALRAAVASMMRDFGDEPSAATVVLIEVFDGGRSVLTRTNVVADTIGDFFMDVLSDAPASAEIPARLAPGLVAGAFRVARAAILAGRVEELPGLATEVSDWMLSLAARPGGSWPRALGGTGYLAGTRRKPRSIFGNGPLGSPSSIGDERERILRATVRLAVTDGFSGLTIPRIRSVAGVSRRGFDFYFASVTDCFLDALEWLARSAAARAYARVDHDAAWDRRAAGLVLNLCGQGAKNGALARLVLVGILDAGRAGLVRREHLVKFAAEEMRNDLPPVGALALDASIAAAWQIAYAEVAPGKVEHLPGLAPLLTHVILGPVRSPAPHGHG